MRAGVDGLRRARDGRQRETWQAKLPGQRIGQTLRNERRNERRNEGATKEHTRKMRIAR